MSKDENQEIVDEFFDIAKKLSKKFKEITPSGITHDDFVNITLELMKIKRMENISNESDIFKIPPSRISMPFPFEHYRDHIYADGLTTNKEDENNENK